MTNRFYGFLIYLSCVSMCLGLGMAALVGQPPVPARQAVPTLIPDNPDLQVARANREAIENGLLQRGTVQLSNGTYHLDRSIQLDGRHSGGTLQGRGRGTILRNSHTSAPYVANCTFATYPLPTGYNDPADGAIGNRVHIPATYPWAPTLAVDLTQFRPGRVVWAYAWNGYWYDGIMEYTRYVIQAVDHDTRWVTLDKPAPPPELWSLKWANGHAIADVKAGESFVTLEDPEYHRGYEDGQDVYVTSGTEWAHECTGEYRKIIGREKTRLNLDRPLRRPYTKAAIVGGPFVTDLTVEDLTIGNPVNTQSNPSFIKFCVRLNLRRVAFGNCLSAAFGTIGYANVEDCVMPGFGGMGVNTCHDFVIRRSRIAGLNCEEGCLDISMAECMVTEVNGSHGIQAHLGCIEFEIRDCRIEGFGFNRGGGNGSPFSIAGRGHRITDVFARNNNPQTGNYLSGDNIRITGVVSDVPFLFPGGDGWRITNSKAPYWWAFDNANVGEGRYTNVDGVTLGKKWEGSKDATGTEKLGDQKRGHDPGQGTGSRQEADAR